MSAATDRRAAGFTLLETLVALVLLGAVMGTVFSLISTVLQGSRRDEERLRLAWVAENLMVRSGLDLQPPTSGTTRQGVSWRIDKEHFDRLETVGARGQNGQGDENTPAAARPGNLSLSGENGTPGPGSENDRSTAAGGTQGGTDGPAAGDAGDRPPAAVDLWQIRVTVQSGRETFTLQTLRAEAVRDRQ